MSKKAMAWAWKFWHSARARSALQGPPDSTVRESRGVASQVEHAQLFVQPALRVIHERQPFPGWNVSLSHSALAGFLFFFFFCSSSVGLNSIDMPPRGTGRKETILQKRWHGTSAFRQRRSPRVFRTPRQSEAPSRFEHELRCHFDSRRGFAPGCPGKECGKWVLQLRTLRFLLAQLDGVERSVACTPLL